jgi:hypothetical protein
MIIIITLDVDLIIAASDLKNLTDIKRSLTRNFKMKDLGQLTFF